MRFFYFQFFLHKSASPSALIISFESSFIFRNICRDFLVKKLLTSLIKIKLMKLGMCFLLWEGSLGFDYIRYRLFPMLSLNGEANSSCFHCFITGVVYLALYYLLQPVSLTQVINWTPTSLTRGRISVWFMTGVVDTADKFMTGAMYTSQKTLNTNISANVNENSKLI